ncbi:plasmid partitioning protein [Streptomyces tendae]|uniref:ParB/RepB/Spo0J family partition protein n=1 Tax=Streptomyces tendae TaxID=1932 RepID=UPI0016754F8F|nr:ParB/RepB/Spo0J family partition protein [Streptomyces tendae]GHB13751.1 plasmid partitioning protein [Streptomyces tendae]
MSKADQLGAGRFGGSTRPVSARRAAIGAATGVPTEGMAPPTRLPVTRISPNPDNPRTTLGDLTELAGSLKEHGQKQAITVMNRDTYIKVNPEREKDLDPDATHVVVDGSSRLAAAREAGLTHLSVMVDDEQGGDGEAILESALVANIHRQDLDPLDEARALHRLLALHGSQVKLAKRLRKSQGWVSQRLALLNLTPELQAVVGEEPVELLRAVAKEPQERQQVALAELKAARARKEAERRAPEGGRAGVEETVPAPVSQVAPSGPEVVEAPQAAVPDPGHSEPVRPPKATGAAVAPPPRVEREPRLEAPQIPHGSASAMSAEMGEEERVPEPRSDRVPTSDRDQHEADAAPPRRLPYEDGHFIAMHLIREMSDTEFDRMLGLLNKHQRERQESRISSR